MLNMLKGRLFLCCVVLQFIPDTMGVLVNSPCTKTSDWNTYHILCPTNQTIYIKRHVIEDGFNRLMFPSLGCSASDAVYCGVELPTNNINLKNNHILDSAVDTCNGRKECSLTKKYFLEAEAALKKFCNASKRPELQNATFRQSIDYECVQDSQIMDMCLTENKIRHFNQPVYLRVLDADCTCNITGSVTRVEILQTMSVKLLIQSNDINIFAHQNTDVSLYGVDIPVQADNLIITTENGSKSSLAMMKIVSKGSFTVRCNNNLQVSSSTVKTLRRAFQIETSFTQSKTNIFFESTTNDQKSVQKEKTESSDVTITHGGVLSWIQTILIIFLLVFSFLIYYKKRIAGHSSVEIGIKDKQEKLILVCHAKNEKKKTSIEIHQADCMCASNNERNATASAYTPLQIVNKVESNIHTSTNNDYLDVI
ncbi:uncharacterized protein [Magallana gigas]|uniref:uncharacterized protein n=1 Tax=Magallana gigas TaxID=29159 RepID=UPI00334132A6